MPMTSEAKGLLSSKIRELRARMLDDLHAATEGAYRLSLKAKDAKLGEVVRIRRERLESWIAEQVRALPKKEQDGASERFRLEVEKDAASTLLNRMVYLRLLEASLALAKKRGIRRMQASILNNLGLVYQALGDQGSALAVFEESFAIKERIGDRRGMANSLANMANVHEALRDLDAALSHLRRALEIHEGLNDAVSVAWDLGEIGGRAAALEGRSLDAAPVVDRGQHETGLEAVEAARARKRIGRHGLVGQIGVGRPGRHAGGRREIDRAVGHVSFPSSASSTASCSAWAASPAPRCRPPAP